jgi:hypothetical protein
MWPAAAHAPLPTTQMASEVIRTPQSAPPPPSREDLIGAICTGYLATQACVHELMPLYRACGVDAAHPRTARCAPEVERVRRIPR